MSDERITFMTQADLLIRIPQERAAFAALWQSLTEAQMIARPGPQDDWSVKDLIAHMTFWENRMLERVVDLLNDKPAGTTPNIDEVNTQVFDNNKDRPLADILAEFEANEARVLAQIEVLDDDQINTRGRYKLDPKYAMLDLIIGDTFGHYAVHTPELKQYIASLSGD